VHKELKDVPINPDLLDSTGKFVEEVIKRIPREIFTGDAGNEEGIGLHGFCVDVIDEMLLTSDDKMSHLVLYVVENPACDHR